jgi:hypothetical protein
MAQTHRARLRQVIVQVTVTATLNLPRKMKQPLVIVMRADVPKQQLQIRMAASELFNGVVPLVRRRISAILSFF